jgi:hypothetical protein
MSQITTPHTPQPAAPAVIDYKTPSARRGRPGWLNPRVLLFVLIIGGALAFVLYPLAEQLLTGGIRQRSDGYMDVDLKTISTFAFDDKDGKLEDVPARFRELDGKKVILHGEMWSSGSAAPELEKFDLVYSIAKCCFSGPPQIQHFIKATSAKGPVPFFQGPVKVKGTFKVDVRREKGVVTAVYHLAVEELEPV